MSALASLPMTIPTRLPARSLILSLEVESSDALSESSESSSLSSSDASDFDALAVFFLPEPDLCEPDFVSLPAVLAFLPLAGVAALAAALAGAGVAAAGAGVD